MLMALLDGFADLQFGPLTSAQRTSASWGGDQQIYEVAMLSGKSTTKRGNERSLNAHLLAHEQQNI